MRKINMSGLRFGRLTVLCEDGRLNGEVVNLIAAQAQQLSSRGLGIA